MIFRDAEGRVLLIEPNYGAETWEIPGGGLGDDQIAALRLADGELKRSKFATRAEAAGMLRPDRLPRERVRSARAGRAPAEW